ncbi:MAG: toxin-antitoxin system YwqK family antitoxin [Cyclobacteriaceae bacterium]|jgi:hypothetical protein|nr:toxin-antitoxin system YwqK family antitoxin [Cyclobacteriaceae bacterium]
MKRIFNRCVYWFMVFSVFALSCQEPKKEEAVKKEKVKDGLFVSHFKNGKVKQEIPMKDGKQNGLAKEYYQHGKLAKEIEYKNGVKDGFVKQYYENGKIAFHQNYKNGKQHGKQERFKEDGNLWSVSYFVEDEPCKGLVEYTSKNEPRKKYPTIVVQPVNNLYKNGTYALNLSMSDKTRAVEFYIGDLDKNGCIDWTNVEYVLKEKSSSVATLDFQMPQGTFIMKTINIIAKVKTLQGNYYITERKYNVSVEFN